MGDDRIPDRFWHRDGTSFDELTVAPSIDASEFKHAHITITRGVVG
jgi:hypothetical protein